MDFVQFCVSTLSLVQSSLASVLVPQSSITQSSIAQSSVPQCSVTQSSGHRFVGSEGGKQEKGGLYKNIQIKKRKNPSFFPKFSPLCIAASCRTLPVV